MPRLKTVQKRTAVLVNGQPRFRVITTVVDRGQLTTPSIFVLSVTEPALPYRDEFVRVAGVADLTELPSLREEGMASGEMLYRSSSCIQDFITVQNANTASIITKDQIDALLLSFDFYESTFEVTTEENTHPRPDPALLSQMTQELETLNTELEETREKRDEANAEFLKLQAEEETQKAACELFKSIQESVDPVEGLVATLDEYINTNLKGPTGAELRFGGPVPFESFGEGYKHPSNPQFNRLNNAAWWSTESNVISALSSQSGNLEELLGTLIFNTNLQTLENYLEEDFTFTALETALTECAEKLQELTTEKASAKSIFDEAQLEVEALQKSVNQKIADIVALCPAFELT